MKWTYSLAGVSALCMPPPIIPTDPHLRTRLLVWGVGVFVMGASGLLFLNGYLDYLRALATAAPELAAEHFHRLAVLVAAVVLLLTGAVTALGSRSCWIPGS